MECAKCGESTVDIPCRSCGEDPLLDGRYRLLSPVGRGASGSTWRARVDATGEVVAIKEMLLSRADAEKTRELWEREVRVLRQLSHPQIPRFIDRFLVGRGRARSLCLVQEFVEGQSLEAEMQGRRYSEDDALEIVRELLPVLDYLHHLSPPVVHRDLKPANIMRREDGTLVLIDFGSVRDVLKDTALGGSTVAGTFGYMAPEQFRGDASPATDYYGLGGLLVTLLTRKAPHTLLDARGQLQWRAHCRVKPTTAGLIEGLLSHEPASRPVGSRGVETLLGLSHAEAERSEAARLFDPQRAPDVLGPVANNPLVAPARGEGAVGTGGGAVVALSIVAILAMVGMATAASVMQKEVLPSPIVEISPAPDVIDEGQPPPLDTGLSLRLVPLEASMNGSPSGYIWNGREGPLSFEDPSSKERTTLRSGAVGRVLLGSDGGASVHLGSQDLHLSKDALVYCKATECEVVPWIEVEGAPEKTVAPAWPSGATEVGEVSCPVAVRVAPAGWVVSAVAEGCAPAFATSAEFAVRQWTFPEQMSPAKGRINVEFTPALVRRDVVITHGESNAKVKIDGTEVGRLPWQGALSYGVHVVELEGQKPEALRVEGGEGSLLVRY